MDTVYTIDEVKRVLRDVRAAGKRIAFVPTLGHLHSAHQGLVRRANEVGEYTVASIFVNPLQFGEGEDYSSYPRTLENDTRKLVEAGADLLFAPDVGEFYPEGSEGTTQVEVPNLSTILCGAFRPGHFRGVTTVVNILFNVLQPDSAVFGEKDYQQLLVIKRMVRDLQMPVEIVSVPTAREPDGLAMSSRNAYLSEGERAQAPALYRTLCEVRDAIRNGDHDFPAMESRSMEALATHGFRPQYFSVRRSADLGAPGGGDELIVLAAGYLGRARLIDNVVV